MSSTATSYQRQGVAEKIMQVTREAEPLVGNCQPRKLFPALVQLVDE